MAKAKKTTKVKSSIEEIVEDLLSRMDIDAQVEVKKEKSDKKLDKENQEKLEHYRIDIQTEESGLLIGHHGETINSLQLLLGVILYKKLGQWTRVVLDVGNYRKMREETIRAMVNRIVDEVEQTGREVVLPYFSPLERRIVHLMLADHKTVSSESAGEGRDRRITIKPKIT